MPVVGDTGVDYRTTQGQNLYLLPHTQTVVVLYCIVRFFDFAQKTLMRDQTGAYRILLDIQIVNDSGRKSAMRTWVTTVTVCLGAL